MRVEASPPSPLFAAQNVDIKQEGPRTYLQHTTKSINQGAVLCTGKKVGEGQLHRAHAGARGARAGAPCSSCLGLLSHGASGRQGGWGCRSAATPDAGHRNRRDDGTGRPTGQTHLNTEEHKDTSLQSRLRLLGEMTIIIQASQHYKQKQKLSEVLIQTSAVQEKYNASHTRNF